MTSKIMRFDGCNIEAVVTSSKTAEVFMVGILDLLLISHLVLMVSTAAYLFGLTGRVISTSLFLIVFRKSCHSIYT